VKDLSNIADKLIPQLECAILHPLRNVAVDAGGSETAEFEPFPIPEKSPGVAVTVFANLTSEESNLESVLVRGESVLVRGESEGISVDFTTSLFTTTLQESIMPALFAFTAIYGLERELPAGKSAPEIKAILVPLSLVHGTLCRQTTCVSICS
jgi:hypothetical protein